MGVCVNKVGVADDFLEQGFRHRFSRSLPGKGMRLEYLVENLCFIASGSRIAVSIHI
jgi:hypothetical protein